MPTPVGKRLKARWRHQFQQAHDPTWRPEPGKLVWVREPKYSKFQATLRCGNVLFTCEPDWALVVVVRNSDEEIFARPYNLADLRPRRRPGGKEGSNCRLCRSKLTAEDIHEYCWRCCGRMAKRRDLL